MSVPLSDRDSGDTIPIKLAADGAAYPQNSEHRSSFRRVTQQPSDDDAGSHNPEVAGSNPTTATKTRIRRAVTLPSSFWGQSQRAADTRDSPIGSLKTLSASNRPHAFLAARVAAIHNDDDQPNQDALPNCGCHPYTTKVQYN